MRAILSALLLAAVLASGCLGTAASDLPRSGPDPTSAAPPAGADSGTPAAHGAPKRTESPVTVRMEGGQFVAEQDVTVSNDFGGASRARLQLATRNGGVAAQAWEQGGYRLAAHLEGRGQSEDDARAALATLAVVNGDALASGLLEFGLQVQFKDLPPAALPVPSPVPVPETGLNAMQRSASIVASVPAEPGYELAANSTNGGVAVAGLHGSRLRLATTNGGLEVQGSWDASLLATTNGGIRLDGTFNDLQASSTNGGIRGKLESLRTCDQAFRTTNGGVSLQVQAEGRGYDVTGRTTNGRITIDLPGAQASGDDVQHATTPGFQGQAVRVTLQASSTNGNVDVGSA